VYYGTHRILKSHNVFTRWFLDYRELSNLLTTRSVVLSATAVIFQLTPSAATILTVSLVKVILRLTISQSVSLGIEHPSGPMTRFFFSYMKVTVLFNWGVLSDERLGLSFVSHSPY
jgi:hypothetical protein